MTTTDRIHIPTDEKIQINFQELRGVPNAVYGLSDGRRFFFSRLPNELDTAFAGRIQNTLMMSWGVSSTICNIESTINRGQWIGGPVTITNSGGSITISDVDIKDGTIYRKAVYDKPTDGPLTIVGGGDIFPPETIRNCRCTTEFLKDWSAPKPQRDHSIHKVGQGFASNEDIWAAVRAFGDGKI